MEIIKKVRLRFIKFFPLTNYEKCIYEEDNFNKTINPLDDNNFFKTTGNIFLLDVYPKSNLDTFILKMEKLIFQNPSKNRFCRTIIDDNFRDRLSHYKSSNNYMSRTNIGYCSPVSKDLKDIIDYIEINIFNLSNDYFGMSFNLILSPKMKEEINNSLISTSGFDCKSYHKYSYNGKKRISRSSCNPEIIRKRDIENKLIELKVRAHNFISKYIELSDISYNSPISLDIYYSNIEDELNHFLQSFNLFFLAKDRHSGLSVIHNKEEKQDFINHDFLLESGIELQAINRSTNLIILDKKDRSDEIYVMTEDLINIFMLTLYSHLLHELNYLISEERTLVETNYNKIGIKFNRIYNKVYKKIFKFKLIFNEFAHPEESSIDQYIMNSFSYLDKSYKKILEKHQIIEKASNDKISISNYSSTFWLTVASIIIAILAIIISLFYNNSSDYTILFNNKSQLETSLFWQTERCLKGTDPLRHQIAFSKIHSKT
jgi:hypothetical protein